MVVKCKFKNTLEKIYKGKKKRDPPGDQSTEKQLTCFQ